MIEDVIAEIEGALTEARIEQRVAGSRELSLAVTKLEEAQMWAERVKDGGP